MEIQNTESKHAETLAHLGKLSRTALLDYALKIGGYLVETYFDNDVGAYFDKSRYKASSFADLLDNHAEDLADLDLSGTTLRNYIAAWNVHENLPKEV